MHQKEIYVEGFENSNNTYTQWAARFMWATYNMLSVGRNSLKVFQFILVRQFLEVPVVYTMHNNWIPKSKGYQKKNTLLAKLNPGAAEI